MIQVSDSLEGYEQLVQISGVDLSDSQLGDFLDGNTEYQMAVELLQAVMSSRIGTVQGIFVGKDTEIKLNYQNRVAISLGSTLELTDKFALAGQVLAEDIGPAETGLLDVSQLGTAYFRPMTTDNMSEIMPPGGTWTDNSAESSEN